MKDRFICIHRQTGRGAYPARRKKAGRGSRPAQHLKMRIA